MIDITLNVCVLSGNFGNKRQIQIQHPQCLGNTKSKEYQNGNFSENS